MQIPNGQGQIRQTNRGDIFGELNESFNIDLTTSPGKILTSRKLERILTNAQLGTPAGINQLLIFGSNYYVFTEDDVYRCSVNDDPNTAANWTEVVAISSDLAIGSDAVVFDGQLRISLDTNIARYNGSASFANNWWTADISGTSLTSGKPHQLHLHRGGQETLFVTDSNLVRYYNATSGHSTVTLQADLTACCIASGVSAIWVGTFNEDSGNAYVYEIYVGEQLDSVPVARNAYKVDGRAVLAIEVIDNIPYIITEKGNIQAFNGAGFTTVATFPFVFGNRPLEGVRPGLIQDSGFARPVHPNGVDTSNDSLFIMINTEADEDTYATNTRSHSGIWEYNKSTGVLNHRFGFADASTSYGASRLSGVGALLIVDNEYTFLLAGANLTDTGLYSVAGTAGQSWVITSEVNSGTIQSSYNTIYHKAKTLSTGEEIHTLYRKTKRDTVYAAITWTGATTFNTTEDITSIAIGDLIRVSHGFAAGEWAMVEAIDHNSTTVTAVTVSRSIGIADEASSIYSDNFKLIDKTMTSENGELLEVGLGETSPWMQIMVIMKGDIEYRSFELSDQSKNERG